jgi:eukaryotic-like serine/threonine-protein kinase
MPFVPPPIDNIRGVFPELADLAQFAVGGFKVVYHATLAAGTEVFKLVCLPQVGATDEERTLYRKEALGRIRREVGLLAKCRRPELVRLGSVQPRLVAIDGVEYVGYTEELVPGDSLGHIIRHHGAKPDETESRRLMLTLLRAIEELWGAHRTVHRDIKPDNVMRTGDPVRPFVLLDLGIAYGLYDTALTHDHGMGPFTPRYMAPEIARPDFRQNIDFRTDLYTTGLTVFEYSSQLHPLAQTRDDLVATISRAILQPPRPLKQDRPEFGDAFCALVDQMLKKKPMLRPSNLAALIADMEGSR